MKRPSTEWLKTDEFADITIMDPDGWDRSNLDASMAEPITRDEFQQRLWRSSSIPASAF